VGEETPQPTPEPEPDHQDDGLDLARAAARAAAGSMPKGVRRRRQGGSGGARRRTDSQVSGSHPDQRDPQLLGSQLERLVAERGWELELRVRGVFARWPELVGEEVGAHCTPEAFTDGKLTVRTDSTAWATQLKLLAPALVRRLNEELGHGTVTLIDIVGPHLPRGVGGRRRTRDSRGPRDTYG
jgi:predicted nucleic acid-binding Zn ribbon protein